MKEILGAHIQMLVREARMNEDVSRRFDAEPQQEVPRLLESLVRQCPNRVYTSDGGRLGRILFYADTKLGYPFNAFIQILKPVEEPQEWDVERQTTLIAQDMDAIEKEVGFWRGVYNLKGDLLTRPEAVYQTQSTYSSTPDYVHSLGGVSCRYSLGPLGVRFYYFTRDNLEEGNTPREQMDSVPEDLIKYTGILNQGK